MYYQLANSLYTTPVSFLLSIQYHLHHVTTEDTELSSF
jgi:hypothetical protein